MCKVLVTGLGGLCILGIQSTNRASFPVLFYLSKEATSHSSKHNELYYLNGSTSPYEKPQGHVAFGIQNAPHLER